MIDVSSLASIANRSAGQLGSRSVTIRSHLPQWPTVTGQISQCADCDGETWHVWQIDGDPGVHMQCAGCGAVYCCGHDCSAGPGTDQGGAGEGGRK